ncbi:MAG: sulfatase-like hydrolase/transferase [Rubripirellula sp.]
MNMLIQRFFSVSWIGLVFTSCLFPAELLGADQELPNIVMIFSDDQGMNDLSCYGSEIQTPVLDRFANQGLRFTQFYAASSICTPSRYGLFTGRHAHRSEDKLTSALMFLDSEDARRGLRSSEVTYVERLRDRGYRTSLVGKWHLGHGQKEFWPTRHGFEVFFGHTGGCVDFFTLRYGNRPDWYRNEEIETPQGYATDVITQEAISEIKRLNQDDAPFYLHLSYNAPHFGKAWNAVTEETQNVMQPKPNDLIRVEDTLDPLRRSFAAKVVGLDTSIGQVLDVLDRLGIADQTLVIFMTDHGGDPKYGGSNLPFRGQKATLYEGGIRVPCLVRWPGKIKAGRVTDQVAWAIDWNATLMDLCDGVSDPMSDGKSILPVLFGESLSEEEAGRTLIWKTGAHQKLGRQSWAAVRKGDWKWVRPPEQSAALYDLGSDPYETTDLSRQYPEVVEQLELLAR